MTLTRGEEERGGGVEGAGAASAVDARRASDADPGVPGSTTFSGVPPGVAREVAES
jgi:hypothetical protein